MPRSRELEIRGIQPQFVRATGIHRFFSAWFGETPAGHASIKGQRGGVAFAEDAAERLDDLAAALVEGSFAPRISPKS